jgi:4-alpha-glucanotransferase
MRPGADADPADVRDALRLLGKRQVVLVVHDASFPFSSGEDVGHGSPYSRVARAFVTHALRLGFNAIQLGPQGRTSAGNASPYDSTLFSRNELALGLGDLVEDPALEGMFAASALGEVVGKAAPTPGRTDHAAARQACERILDAAYARLDARPGVARMLAEFVEDNRGWLVPDAVYAAGAGATSGGCHVGDARRYAFAQMLFHRQHAAWRAWLRGLGVTLWGDLQIGMAPCDASRFAGLFLPGYLLGAPPSRTNPQGQPWGYPVLDPDLLAPAADRRTSGIGFLRARMAKMMREYDGLRIDHPHGLVCPWVYRSDAPDPFAAVQQGARLYESPNLADHPRLARFARVRAEQLRTDPDAPRYADDWVAYLEPRQIEAYAGLFDAVAEAAPPLPDGRSALMCEVLSTQPLPLRYVMERHGLGRYRVTQKADPDDERDVYRSENARPEDWIMVGNHDTPSMWSLAREWRGTRRGAAEADYLARRLRPGQDARPLAAALREDRSALVHAKLSDAFASAASGIKLFFADLLGLEQRYNEPGTVGPHNWTLRVPPDWRAHEERARQGRAVDLRAVLAGALRARGLARSHAALIARLEGRGRPSAGA